MYCTRRALPRRVSDTSSRLAAPCAVVIPGTTSTEIPALRQAGISSSARPKSIGPPPFNRTTCPPAFQPHDVPAGLRERDHQLVDVVLLAGGTITGLADQHFLRLAAGEIKHFG